MTAVFREVPWSYGCSYFYTDEHTTVQNLFGTMGQKFPDSMPPRLCSAHEILICSQKTQYVSRQQRKNYVNFGHPQGICQTLSLSSSHESSSYFANHSSLRQRGKSVEADLHPILLHSTKYSCRLFDCFISRNVFQSRNKQFKQQCFFSQKQKDAITDE